MAQAKNSIQLLNNKGFSLIQGLIISAIVGLTGLGYVIVELQSQKTINRIKTNKDILSLQKRLNARLVTSSAICTSQLAGRSFSSSQAASELGQSFEIAWNTSGVTQLGPNAEFNDLGLRMKSLKFKNAEQLANLGANQIFRVTVVGELEALRVLPTGQDLGERTLVSNLFLVTSGSTIDSCSGLNPRDLISMSIFCAGIGGVWNVTAGFCERKQWDGQATCRDLGGRWVANSCEMVLTPQQICEELGFRWSAGRCDVGSNTIADNGGASTPPGGCCNSNMLSGACSSYSPNGASKTGLYLRSICSNGVWYPVGAGGF